MNNRESFKKVFSVFAAAAVLAAAGAAGIPESSIEVGSGRSIAVSAADRTDYLVKTSVKLLSQNEGTYTSVNKNDCGAVSIGIIQWHGTRALDLLKSIVKANPEQAKNLLGNSLYKEITEKKDWSKRTVNSTESSALSKLLGTAEAKKIEDQVAYNDVKKYVTRAMNLGLSADSVIVYYADLYNFGPVCADRVAKAASSAAGSYKKVTLSQIHNCALKDWSSGQYAPRRKKAYDFCKKLDIPSPSPSVSPSPTKSPSPSPTTVPTSVKTPFNGIYFRACDAKYGSIVDALASIGAKSSFDYRKEIAAVNSIKSYSGTSQENITMLNLLKAGRLLAPGKAPVVTTPVTTPVITSPAVTTAVTASEAVTSVTTEAEPAGTVMGDISMDGHIDVTDLSMLSSYLIGDLTLSEEQKAAADLDGDGKISLADLAKFRQFLSKFISEL